MKEINTNLKIKKISKFEFKNDNHPIMIQQFENDFYTLEILFYKDKEDTFTIIPKVASEVPKEYNLIILPYIYIKNKNDIKIQTSSFGPKDTHFVQDTILASQIAIKTVQQIELVLEEE